MQHAYINALYKIMQEDGRVCSLLSDSGTDYDIMMFRDLPVQCFNFGIAENNKVAAASGMAAVGKIPFVYTTGAFLAYRSYEYIRDDICFQKRNVKIVGMGTGFSAWCTLGPSHHSTEDISALRAIPNLVVLTAATPLEAAKMVCAAYEMEGPVYLRLGMSGEEELYTPNYEFRIGKLSPLFEDGQYTVFSMGAVTAEVFYAVQRLREEGVGVKLFNLHTVKPLDEKGILGAISSCCKAFTVEEHNVIGGIGGAVSEVLAANGAAVPLIKIGLNDCFAIGYGTSAEMRCMNGLDRDSIYRRIKESL